MHVSLLILGVGAAISALFQTLEDADRAVRLSFILFADATRMQRAMHEGYLKAPNLRKRLISPDALTDAGEPVDRTAIGQPLYAVAAGDDHIAPWEQTFKVLKHVVGDKHYVLPNSGHILGVVNPPVHPPTRTYWVDIAHRPDTTTQWRRRGAEHAGSWWPDWMD